MKGRTQEQQRVFAFAEVLFSIKGSEVPHKTIARSLWPLCKDIYPSIRSFDRAMYALTKLPDSQNTPQHTRKTIKELALALLISRGSSVAKPGTIAQEILTAYADILMIKYPELGLKVRNEQLRARVNQTKRLPAFALLERELTANGCPKYKALWEYIDRYKKAAFQQIPSGKSRFYPIESGL